MRLNRLLVSSLFVLPLTLAAQEIRDAAPLKYWSAPLYWRPSLGERLSSAKIAVATASSTAAANGLMFVAMTPCRVIDTRSVFGFPAPFGAPSLVASTTRSFPIQASTLCSIPPNAAAYSFNITVTPVGGGLGFLTVWPAGSTQPNASTLNNPNGLFAVANAAIIPAGSDTSGSIDVFASNPTDLIVDINGYYTSPTGFSGNTAVGTGTLVSNTAGFNNTATGANALENNTTGTLNTAVGQTALQSNTTGTDNTAAGQDALVNNTAGNNNTAAGGSALHSNSTGSNNTAIGFQALSGNSTGSGNIAIGAGAGGNVSTGSSNIHIGNLGGGGDTNLIRIGSLQSSFFAAGIRTVTTGQSNAVPVLIDSNGQLGTISSSARFKEDIHDMADASSGLLQLRPVTYRYKQPYADGSKPLDYGLIAEEVAKVYPDLVAKDAEGNIETVQYQKLTPMLLNELQKAHEHAKEQDATIQAQQEQARRLEDRLAALEAMLAGKTER